jgi:hypothetical protein
MIRQTVATLILYFSHFMANLCITSCSSDSGFIAWTIPFTIEPLKLTYPEFVILLEKSRNFNHKIWLKLKGYSSYFWNWHVVCLSVILIDACSMVIYANWPIQSLLVEARHDIASVVMFLICKYNCFGCSLTKSFMICSCYYFFLATNKRNMNPPSQQKRTPWLPTFSIDIFVTHGPASNIIFAIVLSTYSLMLFHDDLHQWLDKMR